MLVNFDLENRKVSLVMQKAKEKLQMIQVTTKYDKNLKKKTDQEKFLSATR